MCRTNCANTHTRTVFPQSQLEPHYFWNINAEQVCLHTSCLRELIGGKDRLRRASKYEAILSACLDFPKRRHTRTAATTPAPKCTVAKRLFAILTHAHIMCAFQSLPRAAVAAIFAFSLMNRVVILRALARTQAPHVGIVDGACARDAPWARHRANNNRYSALLNVTSHSTCAMDEHARADWRLMCKLI